MTESNIDNLRVVHRLKDPGGQGLSASSLASLQNSGLLVDTCLRQLAVLGDGGRMAACSLDDQSEVYAGARAYAFLLQTVTGLNSSIPGETNVQGQFRRAWDEWRASADSSAVNRIHWVMQRLLRDSRQIRRDYLQGIGGSSYGSLVRKLLNPGADARVLLIGSGELAQSILPYFSTHVLGVWNHHAIAIGHFASARTFAPGAINTAAHWATHLVFTTPPDDAHDKAWIKQLGSNIRGITHLGRRRAQPGVWSQRRRQLPSALPFYNLDDLFELRQSQSFVRSINIQRARRACAQVAAGFSMDAVGQLMTPLAQEA